MRRLLWLGLLFMNLQVGAQDIYPHTPSGWDGNIIVSTVVETNTTDTDLKEGYQLYLDYGLQHDFSSELEGLDIDIQIDGIHYTRRVFSNLNPDPTFGQGLDLIIVLEAGTHTITIILDPDDEFTETDETNNSYELTVSVTAENSFAPESPTDPQSLEYFFDEDPGTGNGTIMALSSSDLEATANLEVNLASISTGFHQVYFRAKHINWGPTQRVSFINLQASDSTVSGIEYFIDTDSGIGEGTFLSIENPSKKDVLNFTVPLTEESIGFHQLYTRALSSNGTWGKTEVISFFNLKAASDNLETLEYFVDDDPGRGNGIPIPFDSSDETISFTVNLSSENTGFHQLFVRAKSTNGTWGLLQRSAFLVEKGLGRQAEVVSLQYFYIGDSEVSPVFEYTFPESGRVIDMIVPLDNSFLEDGQDYTLVVRAIDASGTKSIRRADAFTYVENTAPTIADQNFSLGENPVNGSSIGQVVATDADDDALTYSMRSGNEAGAFSISSSGELTVQDSTLFNFEGNSTFSLTIEVDDSKESSEANVIVDVIDINDAPVITIQNFNVIENSPDGTVIGTVVASDEDEDELTFTISSGNENKAFKLSNAGELSILESALFNFESITSFLLTIDVNDGITNSSSEITVEVEEANDAPAIFNQEFNLAENPVNGTIIGQVNASDEDEDELIFSLNSGNEDGIFSLSSNGMLIVLDSTLLDFESTNSFSLLIEVNDGAFSSLATIIITLENSNETPVMDDQALNVDENSDEATVVGQLVASDVEGDELTYELISGNTNEAFSLSELGQLSVQTTAALDFETRPTFELQVSVTDGNDGTDEAQITVSINDVEESENTLPTFEDASFSIEENLPTGTIIGTLAASDPNGETLAFTLLSGNESEAFALSSSGELTIANSIPLDFEVNPQFNLEVRVSNVSGNTATASITILLNDLEENGAPLMEDQSFSLEENSPNGTLVGTLLATDTDNDPLTFTLLSGNDEGIFNLSETGELSVANEALIDFEVNPSVSLIAEVSDSELTAEATITITITDVDELVLSSPATAESVKVYPNPTQNVLWVDWAEFQEVILSDLSGKEIHRSDQNKLDLSSLNSGIYIIRLKGKDGHTVIQKVSKQ